MSDKVDKLELITTKQEAEIKILKSFPQVKELTEAVNMLIQRFDASMKKDGNERLP